MARLNAVAHYLNKINIDFYRIPANFSPHENLDDVEDARDEIRVTGDLFRNFDIRTTFHVTYYCILNSPKKEVYAKSVDELKCMSLYNKYSGGGNHIELHAGGAYGDRDSSIDRFIDNALSLDDDVFKMLRLENEELAGKIGTVSELERINRETGIPLLFDVAHYRVNPLEPDVPERAIVETFLDTWKGASTFPVLHYSTTAPDEGTHLPVNPCGFWNYVDSLYGLGFDVMLETKEKELDVIKVKQFREAYPPSSGSMGQCL